MDREAWHAAVLGVAKNRPWLRDWTELNWSDLLEWPLKVTQAVHSLGTSFWLDRQGVKESAFTGLSFCMKIIHNKAPLERVCLPMQETQETWLWLLGLEDPLEKEMATLSSILAWEIPWKEDAGKLQFTGSQSDVAEWLRMRAHVHSNKAHFQMHELSVVRCSSLGSSDGWDTGIE